MSCLNEDLIQEIIRVERILKLYMERSDLRLCFNYIADLLISSKEVERGSDYLDKMLYWKRLKSIYEPREEYKGLENDQ